MWGGGGGGSVGESGEVGTKISYHNILTHPWI